jgi:hypothetical protein
MWAILESGHPATCFSKKISARSRNCAFVLTLKTGEKESGEVGAPAVEAVAAGTGALGFAAAAKGLKEGCAIFDYNDQLVSIDPQ